MKDLSQSLRNPRPKLPVEPKVSALLEDTLAPLRNIQNNIIRGIVIKGKILILQKELAKLGGTPPKYDPNRPAVNYERIQHIIETVLKMNSPTASPPKATMNRNEAAAYLGESVWTLDKLRKRGLVKACGGTRHPKYTKTELDRYLRDNSF
jgi:hypothetical protein